MKNYFPKNRWGRYAVGVVVSIPEWFDIKQAISIREQAVGFQVEGCAPINVNSLIEIFEALLECNSVYGSHKEYDPNDVFALVCLLTDLGFVVCDFKPEDEHIIINLENKHIRKINEIDNSKGYEDIHI